MYTNANIKSIDEAVRRLVEGEIFYENNGNIQLLYDNQDRTYPFKKCINGITICHFNFSTYKDWLIEAKWYERDISRGILCYVSDQSEKYLYRHKASIAIIIDYNANNDFKFLSNNDECWRYAKPITPSELNKFIHNAKSVNIEDSQL